MGLIMYLHGVRQLGSLAVVLIAVAMIGSPSAPALGAEPDPAQLQNTVGPEYVIGPGDTLDVFVWRNADLTKQVPVRPDGKISTPLVEDMVAVGKTPTQLARDVEKVLAEFIRSPKVNIIVANAVSANSQVRVVGLATTPRALPYREGLTVMDVVITVGGLSEFAAGNRAKIVRAVPGDKPKELRVRLKDLLEKGDMRQNIVMQPGDVLVIPESRF
ncbi:MAG: XrtA/PEP-CTERM system exopolysaccharide export protein [Pseudomonadota bacterium]